MAEEKKAEKEPEIQILSIHETVVFPKLNQPKKVYIVTYWIPPFPPRSVHIPEEEYDPKKLKELILKDFEKWRKGLV